MHKGFSLIELLVTIGITGILVAMAVAQFNEYKIRARHATANVMAKDLYFSTQLLVDELVKSWTGSGMAQSECMGGGAFVSIRRCIDLNHTSKMTVASLTGGANSKYYTDPEYYINLNLLAPPINGIVSTNLVSYTLAVVPCRGEIASIVNANGVMSNVHKNSTFYWQHACNL